MIETTPAELPPISVVEVVDLAGISVGKSNFVTKAADAPTFGVDGADAQRIAELFRSLPPGEQARCHIPPFGFRFFSHGSIICQASICWMCSNIYGIVEGRELLWEFESSSPIARELLSMLEKKVGHPAAEQW